MGTSAIGGKALEVLDGAIRAQLPFTQGHVNWLRRLGHSGRTGSHWARKLVEAVPMSSIRQINRLLGRNFVTKYGTRQGIIVLGRAAPFGIGALIGGGLNGAFSQMTILAANRAFGRVPDLWPSGLEGNRPDSDPVFRP